MDEDDGLSVEGLIGGMVATALADARAAFGAADRSPAADADLAVRVAAAHRVRPGAPPWEGHEDYWRHLGQLSGIIDVQAAAAERDATVLLFVACHRSNGSAARRSVVQAYLGNGRAAAQPPIAATHQAWPDTLDLSGLDALDGAPVGDLDADALQDLEDFAQKMAGGGPGKA